MARGDETKTKRKPAGRAAAKKQTSRKTMRGGNGRNRSTTGKRGTTARSGASKTAAKRGASKTTARKTAAKRGASKTTARKTAAKRAPQRKMDIGAMNLSNGDRRYVEKYGKQLSPSILRAKWMNDPDDHQDRNGQSLVTRNHDVIRRWAEERKAVPSTVPGTEHDNHLGVLRFDFPGYGGQSLQEVSWEDWFRTFDDRELVFLFQEFKKDGSPSNFFKLNSPFREEG